MNTSIRLCLASVLTLCLATPVLAQNAQQGDYYRFQPWVPQQASPAREQRIQQGGGGSTTRQTPRKNEEYSKATITSPLSNGCQTPIRRVASGLWTVF